jgi:bacterioferritin
VKSVAVRRPGRIFVSARCGTSAAAGAFRRLYFSHSTQALAVQREISMSSHIAQLQEIRERARQHITDGAVTQDYRLDRDKAVAILNEALATELVCVLRYKFHYFMASGIHSQSVKEEFLEHAKEEQQHADQIAERIKQLGGKPELNPAVFANNSHSEYKEGNSLTDMLKEDLIAERIAIESYREMAKFFGEQDPTTRRMLEEILAKEEEHADDLTDLLYAQSENGEPRKLYAADEVQTGGAAAAAGAGKEKH